MLIRRIKMAQLHNLRALINPYSARLPWQSQLMQNRVWLRFQERSAASVADDQTVLFQLRNGLPHGNPAHFIRFCQFLFRRKFSVFIYKLVNQQLVLQIDIDLVVEWNR